MIRRNSLMALATDPEQQKRWLAQWRFAEVELLRQKQVDLQALSANQALADADLLLALAPESYRDPKLETYSGLVEQQRIFHRLKS